MDVSIIIVNYNGFNLLKDCLTSIEYWTKDVNYEIIVIDNNSDEGNIEEITSQFKKLTLIKNNTNRGFAAANNQGLNLAKGQFVLFLNNDTIFIENTLKKIISFIKDKNKFSIVGCKLLNIDNSHQISIVDFDNLLNLFGENFFLYKIFSKSKYLNRYYQNDNLIDKPISVDVIKGAFIFGFTNGLKEINGFDERFFFYAEETDLCYRLKKCGGTIYYFPDTSIIHIGGATTDNMPWFMFKNLSISKIQFFQKHFSRNKLFFATFIHYLGMFLRIPLYFFIGIFTFNKFHLQKTVYFFRLLFFYPKNIFRNLK